MIVKVVEKINFRPRATVARMPEPAAVKADQAPKRKRSKSRIPPDPEFAAKRRRHITEDLAARQRIAGKLGNLRRWGTIKEIKSADVPPDMMPAVVQAVIVERGKPSVQRIDTARETALTIAAEASPRIVGAMVEIALDPARGPKDRIAAGRVVLAVAGLVDGQAANKRAGDDGDPRDLDAGGLRRLALSAQARLSALEAAATEAGERELAPTHIPSDATSEGQQAQAVEPAQQSALPAAPAAEKTPEPFE